MKLVLVAAVAALVSGCAFQVTMMPRDSGTVYSGEMHSSGGGRGTMTVYMDGVRYDGEMMKASSDAQFGFAQAYGSNNRGVRANTTVTTYSGGGNSTYKAILSSNSGRGLRCDLFSSGMGATGVCMDDKGRLMDVIIAPKSNR